MYELFDIVKLKRAIPGIPLPVGSVGTIVHVHSAEPLKYLVEFLDALGANGLDADGQDTLGVYPAHADDLEEER